MTRLETAYLNKGYHLEYKQDFLIIKLPQRDGVFFIAKESQEDEVLSYDQVRQLYEQFSLIGRQTDSHHCLLYSEKGFNFDCSIFEETNLRLVSSEYLMQLQEDDFIELLAHNQRTYREVISKLKESRFAAVEQATGTGKSSIILHLLKDYNFFNKLVVAPSWLILDKLKEVHGDQNTRYLTYQRLNNLKIEELNLFNPALIIFDELHRMGAAQWSRGCQNIIDHFKDAKIVGLSATPIRYLDKQRDIVEEFFQNQRTTPLSLSEAIANHILPSPVYISALYSIESEINSRKERVLEQEMDPLKARRMLESLSEIKLRWENTSGLSHLFRKYMPKGTQVQRWIVFCENVEHLNQIKNQLNCWIGEAFPTKKIRFYSIYSGCSNEAAELKRFISASSINQINLLLSVDKFNEGVHLPKIDGVMFFRKTISPIIYYQQLGRALTTDGKQPIIFDLVNNFNQVLCHNFLKDAQIAANSNAEKLESKGLPYTTPHLKFYDELQDIHELFKQLDQSLKRNDWGESYRQLVDFYFKKGHLNCSKSENKALNIWITTQRQLFKKGQLASDRVELLNQIHFDWDPSETAWNQFYNQFISYVQQDPELIELKIQNKSLYYWVGEQRKFFKKGTLKQERIELLNQINFDWNPLENKWNSYYQELSDYIDTYGDLTLLNHHNTVLNTWVISQRRSLRQGKLSSDRVDKLNLIGFDWNPEQTTWMTNYNELKKRRQLGQSLVVKKSENIRLYAWIRSQKTQYRKGGLTLEQIELLEQIEFSWD